MEKIKVFEAFAGIGSQKKALENIKKFDFEICGLAEWFVPAIIMYECIHNKLSNSTIICNKTRKEMEKYLESKPLSWDSKTLIKKNFWQKKSLNILRISYTAVINSEKRGNIFDINLLYKRSLKDIDLLTYSFPCQDLSQQGNQKGMKENSGTRSGLLWQIEKAISITKKSDLPKYLLMENVPAVLYKKNKNDFLKWKKKLESLGYKNSISVLNSADFGSCQARKRAFMLSSLNEKVELPIGSKKYKKTIKDILEKKVNEKDILTGLKKYDLSPFVLTKSNIRKAFLINYSSFNSESYVYDPNFVGPTLTATGANSRIKIKYNNEIRKLNSLEAFKYMGFTKKDYNKIDKLNFATEAQKIFVCGNSISVEVLENIFERLI